MKKIPLLICLSLLACSQNYSSKSSICGTLEIARIQFTRPFSFKKVDTLVIDKYRFTHVNHLDSLELGDYLPGQNPIIVELNGKQAKVKSNEISLGRALAKKLMKSGNYDIRNVPELLTSGTLEFSRKDGNDIHICIPKNYNGVLSRETNSN